LAFAPAKKKGKGGEKKTNHQVRSRSVENLPLSVPFKKGKKGKKKKKVCLVKLVTDKAKFPLGTTLLKGGEGGKEKKEKKGKK